MSRPEGLWRVGRWAPGEYVDLPWYACDRGGWFGPGQAGRSFKTHAEALEYANRIVQRGQEVRGKLSAFDNVIYWGES